MENLKKWIIIITVALLIIMVILVLLKKKEKNEEQNNIIEEPFDIGNETYNKTEVSFKDYKIVNYCFQTYIDMLNTDSSRYYGRDENDEFTKIVSEEETKQNICDLLSENYIKGNDITTDNIDQYVNISKESQMAIITDIEILGGKEDSVISYGINGLIILTSDFSISNEVSIIVNIDYKNNTFSIEPTEKNIDSIKYKEISSIKENDNNLFFENENMTQEDIAKEYFRIYKYILLSNPEIAYNHLDNEYKEKRFPMLEDFEKYVERNRDLLKGIRIEQYDVLVNDTQIGSEYICVDQYDNAYIFNEKDTLKYSVILDLYTIELSQIEEKYDESNAQQKVALNIQKLEQALNSGDYKYVYGKLNEKFRNNNYPTVSDLETQLKEQLPKFIKINYKNFTNEGTTYIYDLSIEDLMGKSEEVKDMEIIMKLKDNRDFEFSFSIKE